MLEGSMSFIGISFTHYIPTGDLKLAVATCCFQSFGDHNCYMLGRQTKFLLTKSPPPVNPNQGQTSQGQQHCCSSLDNVPTTIATVRAAFGLLIVVWQFCFSALFLSSIDHSLLDVSPLWRHRWKQNLTDMFAKFVTRLTTRQVIGSLS